MKMLSWNVNGLRAVVKKGFFEWFREQNADVVCLQETKIQPDQVDEEWQTPNGYRSFWHSAERKGYSSVATYSRIDPIEVRYGIGVDKFDVEGRVLQTEFKDFLLINAYFPNSQEKGARISYKIEFCEAIQKLCKQYVQKGKNVVVCGDFNIAHTEIDLKNPKQNQKNAGFLPEERSWMGRFLNQGFVDIFRKFNQGVPDQYTWWSYRFQSRKKNIGWRIDYHCINEGLEDRVLDVGHQRDVMGSDHCPVLLTLKR